MSPDQSIDHDYEASRSYERRAEDASCAIQTILLHRPASITAVPWYLVSRRALWRACNHAPAQALVFLGALPSTHGVSPGYVHMCIRRAVQRCRYSALYTAPAMIPDGEWPATIDDCAPWLERGQWSRVPELHFHAWRNDPAYPRRILWPAATAHAKLLADTAACLKLLHAALTAACTEPTT